jgi:hypothetical protein
MLNLCRLVGKFLNSAAGVQVNPQKIHKLKRFLFFVCCCYLRIQPTETMKEVERVHSKYVGDINSMLHRPLRLFWHYATHKDGALMVWRVISCNYQSKELERFLTPRGQHYLKQGRLKN